MYCINSEGRSSYLMLENVKPMLYIKNKISQLGLLLHYFEAEWQLIS